MSSVGCGMAFGNNRHHSLFQNTPLVLQLRMHPDLWGAGFQQLWEGFWLCRARAPGERRKGGACTGILGVRRLRGRTCGRTEAGTPGCFRLPWVTDLFMKRGRMGVPRASGSSVLGADRLPGEQFLPLIPLWGVAFASRLSFSATKFGRPSSLKPQRNHVCRSLTPI